jgi:hypothetical protein
MRVRFTQVHLVGGTRHEHIGSLKATDPKTGKNYDAVRAKWVTFIEEGGTGFVHDKFGNEVDVYVNHNQFVKWVQTRADGIWTDNLLQLPKY